MSREPRDCYWVYVLRSIRTGRFYIGHTQGLSERIDRHNDGRVRSTKGKGPWVLWHSDRYQSRAEAMQRERDLKRRKSSPYLRRLVSTSRS